MDVGFVGGLSRSDPEVRFVRGFLSAVGLEREKEEEGGRDEERESEAFSYEGVFYHVCKCITRRSIPFLSFSTIPSLEE